MLKLNKILFATDFSTCGDAALGMATALARDSGARLLITHVEETPIAYGGGEMYYGIAEPATEDLENMLKELKPSDSSVPYEHHLITGSPASAVVEFADSEGADLIVIGSHGRTGIQRVLMGSIAEHIVRHANCPVLTYKKPHNNQE